MSKQNGQSTNGQSASSSRSTRRRSTGSTAGAPPTEFLNEVLDTEADANLAKPLRDLVGNDFPMANMRRSDREYFRLLSENVSIYTKEQFPPQDSLIQGDVGACLLEDPGYQAHALSESQRNQIETLLMSHFARASRGVDGWQQDKLNESVQTKRVEDNRREQEQGGLIGGLFD
jgi:hypothetical protein